MRFDSQFLVDKNRFYSNVDKLRKLAPKNEILFMVKANAYGHGLLQMTELALDLGIKEFGVASLSEAMQLRRFIPKHKFEIYVFSDTCLERKEYAGEYKNSHLIPVLSSLEQVKFFLNHEDFKFVPLCLKFNTGMNRIGIGTEEIDEVLSEMRKGDRDEIHHLMSHFACSGLDISLDFSQRQYKAFTSLKEKFRSKHINVKFSSMANSGALEQGFALAETHIRPGLMLYGPTSLIEKYQAKSLWTGEAISQLEAKVLSVRAVKKGDPIGYGATPCFGEGWVAHINLGYGDGLLNSYSGLTLELARGEAKILGRVSMDMTALWFKKSTDPPYKEGEKIKIWEYSNSTILKIAKHLSSIPYEVFCQIGERVPRAITS